MSDDALAAEAMQSGRSVEDVRQAENAKIPLGSMATPEQVASVCVFLASDLASHVAGASIVVNGAQ